MSDAPIILMDPHPRKISLIFSEADRRRLDSLGNVLWFDGRPALDEQIEQNLARAVAIVGQTAMPRSRLDRAPKLRAIVNVEGNFLPNIDYAECWRRNIHVLNCGPAFAPAVAEMALGLALSAARGIVQADHAFRTGCETYGGASNHEAFLLRGRTFGLIGCGNVGKCLLPLLRPFAHEILVHDPWLHTHTLEEMGVEPVDLHNLLQRSQIVFVLAAATTENQRGLTAQNFLEMKRGSVLVLVSRADLVDFDALLDAAESGHIRVAIDVFPTEPVPAEHPVRKMHNTILSSHRSGGLPETYREVGRMVADDLELILGGLPPQRMQRAVPELAMRYRSRPVGVPPLTKQLTVANIEKSV